MSSWIALGLLATAGGLGVVIQQVRLERMKRTLDGWRNSTSAQAKILVGYAAQVTRLEHDADVLRAAIAELESDVTACSDPAVIRSRLRRVLSFDSAGTGPLLAVSTAAGTNPAARGDG